MISGGWCARRGILRASARELSTVGVQPPLGAEDQKRFTRDDGMGRRPARHIKRADQLTAFRCEHADQPIARCDHEPPTSQNRAVMGEHGLTPAFAIGLEQG